MNKTSAGIEISRRITAHKLRQYHYKVGVFYWIDWRLASSCGYRSKSYHELCLAPTTICQIYNEEMRKFDLPWRLYYIT